MNEPRRIAYFDVSHIYARHLSQILDKLPRDAKLVRAMDQEYRAGQRFHFESQFFKEVPFGNEMEHIEVTLHREELQNGDIDYVVKEVDWPIGVEFPALKKKEG